MKMNDWLATEELLELNENCYSPYIVIIRAAGRRCGLEVLYKNTIVRDGAKYAVYKLWGTRKSFIKFHWRMLRKERFGSASMWAEFKRLIQVTFVGLFSK